MIKSSAFGIRQLVLAASAALLCGLTSVSAWADGGLSLSLAVPGLDVFLGDPLVYYAPPPTSTTAGLLRGSDARQSLWPPPSGAPRAASLGGAMAA